MEKVISNPNKANHKLYILLIFLFMATLILSFSIPNNKGVVIKNFSEILKNLSYGCIASTFVAWLIDCSNAKTSNKKFNAFYDSVYVTLKVGIASYIEEWANLCAVSFKDTDYYQEKHTWIEWYQITKDNYHNATPERQKHLLSFYHNELRSATKYVNNALNAIYAQQHVLTANDVMDKQMEQILSDIKFEFYALSLDLEHEDHPELFWTHMDAINSDFQNYFGNWIDIRYYNYVHFCPYAFHKDTTEHAKAYLASKSHTSKKNTNV